jgi:hypothetical protein
MNPNFMHFRFEVDKFVGVTSNKLLVRGDLAVAIWLCYRDSRYFKMSFQFSYLISELGIVYVEVSFQKT